MKMDENKPYSKEFWSDYIAVNLGMKASRSRKKTLDINTAHVMVIVLYSGNSISAFMRKSFNSQ